MTRSRSLLPRTVAVTAGLAISASLVGGVAPPAAGDPASGPTAGAAVDSPLTLRVVNPRITATKYGKRVYADLGAFLVAGQRPFEVRTTRVPSYAEPVVSRLVIGEPDSATNGETDDIELGEELVDGFDGLQEFLHLRVRDADGRLVANRVKNFCGSGQQVRTEPDAPDTSPYPSAYGCYAHPFTLGGVIGIQQGWAVPAVNEYGAQFRLPLGRYEVTVSIDMRYRELLDLSNSAAAQTIQMRVVDGDCAEGAGCRGAAPAGRDGSPRPLAHEPTADTAPPAGALPDLRSLPSTGIRITKEHFLAFGATVWNAGPSTLVVDGFRRADEDVMDSYQLFYRADGTLAGSQHVGTMKWDPRDGHFHWHFQDFARYRLLDADRQPIGVSKKEAFCLANTDAVDYTVPGAEWQPENTDLETSCGSRGSLAVREVLDTGSGDTYSQYRPGQSFNLSQLRPGIYYISVEANPLGNLVETDETNNVALRKIKLTRSEGKWQVKVFDVGLIHTH